MRGPAAGPCAAAEPTAPPADRPAIDREQAEALHSEIDRLPALVAAAGGPLLLRGPHARRGRAATPMPGRHAPQPAGPGEGEAPDRPGPARGRPVRRRDGRRPGAPIGLGVHSSPPVRFHHPGRDRVRGPSRRRRRGARRTRRGAGPGGLANHARSTSSGSPRCPLLLLAAVAAGAGYLTHSLAMQDQPGRASLPASRSAQAARTEPRPPDAAAPGPTGRMTVTGRVLDPDGKPVERRGRGPGREAPHARGSAPATRATFALLGQGRTDGDGRYPARRAPHDLGPRLSRSIAMAAAPGYGLGWAELNPDAERPAAEITLQPEQVVRARLVDVDRAPAKGVEVRVSGVWRPDDQTKGGPMASRSGSSRREGLRTWPKAVQDRRPGADRRARHRPRRRRRPRRCATSATPARASPSAPTTRPRAGRRPWCCSRPSSSRAASWPTTPAGRSRTPSSRSRPWSGTSTPTASPTPVPRRRPGAISSST